MTFPFAITLFGLSGACFVVMACAFLQSTHTTSIRQGLLAAIALCTALSLVLRAINAPMMQSPPLLWGLFILASTLFGALVLYDLAFAYPARLRAWVALSVIILVIFAIVGFFSPSIWAGWGLWGASTLSIPGLLALSGIVIQAVIWLTLLLLRLQQSPLPQITDRISLWAAASGLWIVAILLLAHGTGFLGVIGGAAAIGALALATYTILHYRPIFLLGWLAQTRPQPALPFKRIQNLLGNVTTPGDAIRAVCDDLEAYLGLEAIQIQQPTVPEASAALQSIALDIEAQPIELDVSSTLWQAFRQQQAVELYDLHYHPAFAEVPIQDKVAFAKTQMALFIPLHINGRCALIMALRKKRMSRPLTAAEIQAAQVGMYQLSAYLTSQPMQETILSLDQSLLRAKSELNKLEAIKSDFITIASHELRTPLAQLRGYIDIVESIASDPNIDKSQSERIFHNLRRSTNRLEELISAMLDTSQLEVGEMPFKFVSAQPETLIKLVTDPLKEPVAERRLTLAIEDMSALPPIRADMPRLVQAMRNVITNAIKYTPDQGQITISAYLPNDAPEAVRFAIEDTGIGIDPAQIDLIFDKFYRGFDTQLHSTGTYKFMGAGPGLGLTIARGIIQAHGGKINAKSEARNLDTCPGSTFYIDLPIEEESSAETVGTRPTE